jgi:hypothetical protein
MRLSVVLALALLLALALPQALSAQGAMPKMSTVEPSTGKAGDELTVAGENLDKGNVAEIYLTDGKVDVKLPLVSQAATALKFKVPADAKSGRWSLMLLTTGKDPKLIEQPVKVTIE